jgi:hypothetical protein
MKGLRWVEATIRAGDFAGLVPASRGAHCRPLHPRLASLCCPEEGRVDRPWCRSADRGGRRSPPRPGREIMACGRRVRTAANSMRTINIV